MTKRRRRIIAYCVAVEEVFAIILITFGLFTRISGVGNPIGTVYMYVGIILIIVGLVAISLTFNIKEPKY
jgi:hypothetical protein